MLRQHLRVIARSGQKTRMIHIRSLTKSQLAVQEARRNFRTQEQRRKMGFFSNLKKQFDEELEKNEDLKKSFEELNKTKEKLENVEKIAKKKMQEVSSKTGEAAKNFQEKASSASQKMKDQYDEAISTAAKLKQEEEEKAKKEKLQSDAEANTSGEQNPKSNQPEGEKSEDPTQAARTFIGNFFSGLKQKKENLVSPITRDRWRREWGEAVKELFGDNKKRTVDEALSSVKTTKAEPAPKEGEEKQAYDGPTALVAVKEDESAWQKISARFRETPIIQGMLDAAKQAARTNAGKKVREGAKMAKDKVSDTREDLLEFWETSQNPWVYRLSSIYDGFFGETPVAVAIKEIRRAEPDFILEKWKNDIEEVVLPGVLEAFLRGNSKDLKKWLGQAAYNTVNHAIRERKSHGLLMDPNVLSIDNVEIPNASVSFLFCFFNLGLF
jgi:import inner membrane translocase subunit TIM44